MDKRLIRISSIDDVYELAAIAEDSTKDDYTRHEAKQRISALIGDTHSQVTLREYAESDNEMISVPATERLAKKTPWQSISYNGLATDDSCFATWQLIQLANGEIVSAEDIYRRLTAWETPEAETFMPLDTAPCLFVGGARTRARGRRISFTDGTDICLTDGHVLYMCPSEKRGYAFFDTPIISQYAIHVRDVRPGLTLGDKVVAAVEPLGIIDGIRLWTDRPEWVVAAGNIPVGTRWQEVLSAWGMTETNPPQYDAPQDYLEMRKIRGYKFPLPSDLDLSLYPEQVAYDDWRVLGEEYHIERSLREYSSPVSRGGADYWLSTLMEGEEVVTGSGIGNFVQCRFVEEYRARFMPIAKRVGINIPASPLMAYSIYDQPPVIGDGVDVDEDGVATLIGGAQ